ncbi:MAG TPA: hypothetical protein VF127_06120, partial [Nitrospira sp.]
DGFFEERALLAVTDNAPLVHTRGGFFIGFLRGALICSHVLTLADHLERKPALLAGPAGYLLLTNTSQYVKWGNCDQMCNPDAIMTYPVSDLSLCLSPVRGGITQGSSGAFFKIAQHYR